MYSHAVFKIQCSFHYVSLLLDGLLTEFYLLSFDLQ